MRYENEIKNFTCKPLFFNRFIISDHKPKNCGMTGVCTKLSWHFTY
jgi:hypothetical protein